MRKTNQENLFKVKSIVNNDIYYSSDSFPTKFIDGKPFIGVKKFKDDSEIFYMSKENVVNYNG